MKSKPKQDHWNLRLTLALVLAGLVTVFIEVEPSAQTKVQYPVPTTHVTDLAGVLDDQTKQRLENILENLRQRSKIDFYVATVENTAGQDIFEFSRSLARDWDLGARTTVKKSLLMVLSTNDKVAFIQFSRSVQGDLPDGVLGEMSQRMRAQIADSHFSDAVNVGIDLFVGTLARKVGLTLADFEQAPVTASVTATPEPTPAQENVSVTMPIATVTSKPGSEQKADKPRGRSSRTSAASLKAAAPKVNTPEDDAAEAEEVDLTLTLPFEQRVPKLKEFLATHPTSKVRAHATELLISAYAALGDQKLKSGDTSGGIELLFLAIDEAPVEMSDKLFSGVIAQIPLNLYIRDERAAAFKAATNIESRFGSDAKRLLTLASFYLGIEQGDEAARVAAKAVMLAPDLAEAHHALAVGLHISLRLTEAIAEYKRALELDPHSKVSRRSLADLYRATGKIEEALALYREQLTTESSDKAARAGLVICLLELGKRDEANTELEAALKEDPRNLTLLTGVAYWFAAHDESEKSLEFARRAVEIEPRYTWAQIAAARALIARRQPLEAERALRYAKQYGKFPTLDYELANVLAAAGLYDEANEALRQSFTLKVGQLETRLAGRLLARESDFLELLAPERRSSIFQATPADTASNARMLKALFELNSALNDSAGGVNEDAAVAAAKEFSAGDDEMRVYRQLYAATRLLRKGIGLATVQQLAEAARTGINAALDAPAVTVAVQAEEFREIRARAIASGGTPNVPEAPRNVLGNILKGRIEDLLGWSLFNQDKAGDAIPHLKQAATVLPEATPSWRTALWHLGAALEQTDQKAEALNYYIKSYISGEPDPVRRRLIEQLYVKINGSMDGLEQRLTSAASTPISSAVSEPASPAPAKGQPIGSTDSPSASASPEAQPASASATPSPEVVASPVTEKPAASSVATESSSKPAPSPPEVSPTPSAAPTPTEEQAMAQAAARLRATIKITGRVADANNKGIENVVVVLISPRGTVLVATTDANGKYSFSVSPSQRNYRIVPSKEGYSFDPIDKTILAFSEDLKEIDFIAASRTP